jgi:ubiquinone/menaquinone biosynthesis C-methylase UbiE
VLCGYADRVTLADPTHRQLEVAGRYLDQDPAIDTRLTDAAHLDFADASVDLAVMVRVLHHLPDPARELSEIARIVKPGRLRRHRGSQRQARGQPAPVLAQRQEDPHDAGRHPV